MTDLLDAVFNCHLGKIKNFVDNGRNVNYKIPETEGCTVLHIVTGTKKVSNKEEVLSYLLDIGADPNARSNDDLTPVHIAAMWNNCFELEKLLQRGGNPWLLDNENKNAFDLAADNCAYEAYQLLNRYHADNKLNFRTCNKAKLNVLFDGPDSNYLSKASFYSANEDFPLVFSSSDNESVSYLIDVSNIMKKNCSKKQQAKDSCNSCNSSRNCDIHCWNCKRDNAFYKSATFLHDEVNSLEGSDSSVPQNNFERIVESDDLSGIILVENRSSVPPSFSNKNHSTLIVSDWQSCRSDTLRDSSDCLSYLKPEITVPKIYSKLSNSAVFKELLNLGDRPGPVNEFTREVYLKRLTLLKSGCHVPCFLPEPKFCTELYQFLSHKLNLSSIQEYANMLAEEFNTSKIKTEWREGNQKSCFNYFLLDPRVTQNLPARHRGLTSEHSFPTFVEAIFYVGKGTKGRPYSHLLDAVKVLGGLHSKSEKINHILDIWNCGYGVISLHCFHNCIPVEAYTQEACVIEAIGVKNLTNVRVGNYYGQAAKWTRSRKRQVGIFLLNRALQIFFYEGEKQIKPKDLKKT